MVSLPDADYTREALEKLEFFGVIDFFLSETAQHADVVFSGSLQEEEEGLTCQRRGARRFIFKKLSILRAMRDAIHGSLCRSGEGGWIAASIFPFDEPREILRRNCGWHREADIADYYGITYERIDRQHGIVLALPHA